ncbi:complement factor H [Pelodytes ibericus]
MLLGYLVLLTALLCCGAAPTESDHCSRPERLQELELQGEWEEETYAPGKVAIYTCRPGYSRLGVFKKACVEGKWTTVSDGRCKKKSCGHPEDIPFGTFELIVGDEFVFGSVVEYTCDDGYQMVSRQKTRECTASGWSNFPPHCEVRKCAPVEVAEGVNLISTSFDDEFSVGQVVRFECKNSQQKLNGPAEVFCTSEGDWNAKPPVCEIISCKVPQVSEGKVLNPKQVYNEDENLTFKCNANFKPYRNGIVTCTKHGWSPEPACEEISCYPEYVTNGNVVKTKDVYKAGETITLKCNAGFQIEFSPDEPRICTAAGWAPPLKCISQRCSKPEIIDGDLYYYYSFPKNMGTSITYYCNTGFRSPGKNVYDKSVCTETGWDPKPKCSRTCPSYEAEVENGQILEREHIYLTGEKITFTCHKGYLTQDKNNNGVKECLPNGKFTPAKCSRYCEMKRLNDGNYEPQKNNFDVGEYLKFECNDRFMTEKRKLTETVQCLQSGWSVVPKCTEIKCAVPNNNLVSEKKVYYADEVAQFSCKDGYKLTGSEVSQCFYYGWGPELPNCEVFIKTAKLAKLNGQSIEHNLDTSTKEFSSVMSVEFGNRRFVLKKLVALSLDAEKAFDSVGWGFLSGVLDRFEFKGSIKTAIMALYTAPTAKTVGPGISADWFPVLNGTRQGCPFAPLLYILTLEPLVASIRVNIIKCLLQSDNKGLNLPKKKTFKVNEKANLSCKKKFILNGSPIITCSEHGWEPKIPYCTEIVCRVPSYMNVEGRPNLEFHKYDQRVTFSCKNKISAVSPVNSRCTKDGWMPQLPVCPAIEPENPNDEKPDEKPESCTIPKDNTAIRSPHAEKYDIGKEVSFSCEEKMQRIGSGQSTCTLQGWVPELPTCEAKNLEHEEPTDPTPTNGEPARKKCPPAHSPANAEIVETKKEYYSGDTVDIQCLPGFTLHGSGRIQCLDGKWQSSPMCIQLQKCGDPPVIKDGKIIEETKKKEYFTDDIVSYSCNPGYHTSGSAESRCTAGRWLAAPVCTGDPCAQPPSVTNGNIVRKNANYNHGDSADYACEIGYKFAEQSQAKCLEGKWWQIPACVSATCPTPPNIDNGRTKSRVKDKYASGETVQYVCNSGYAFEKGNEEAKCEDTQWKSVPVCRRKGDRCGSPPIVKYGDYLGQRKLNYDSGTLLEYKCPNYYKPQGSLTIKCEDGVWGDPPICLEPCTAKDTDADKNNIMFRWIGASKLYSEHDDIMEFICKPGFENPEPRLRVKCNRGVIPYPTCYHIGSCLLSQQSMKSRNIYLNRSIEIRNGEGVKFECNEGMMPENTLAATCNNRVLDYPKCIVSKKCNVPTVPNGNLKQEKQDSYDSGSTVDFECDENHVIYGSINVKCENGKWSALPQCLQPCTVSLGELSGRNIELKSVTHAETTLKDGEDIPVKCKAGFRNPNTAISLKGECNDGKMKYSRCFNGPTCRLIQENLDKNNLELDPIHNNDVYYGEGEDVKFRCKYGFNSTSKPTAKCGVNGLIYPTCTEENFRVLLVPVYDDFQSCINADTGRLLKHTLFLTPGLKSILLVMGSIGFGSLAMSLDLLSFIQILSIGATAGYIFQVILLNLSFNLSNQGADGLRKLVLVAQYVLKGGQCVEHERPKGSREAIRHEGSGGLFRLEFYLEKQR